MIQAMAFQVKKLQEIMEAQGICYAAIRGIARVRYKLVTEQQHWWQALHEKSCQAGSHQSKKQNNKVHERNDVHLVKTPAKVNRKFTQEGLAP